MADPALPDYALTSYDALLRELGLDDDLGNRTAIAPAILAVSDRIARFCSRQLHFSTQVVEYHKGYGRNTLLLNRPPIVEITSIVIDDRVNSEIAVDSDMYYVEDAEIGRVRSFTPWPCTGLLRPGIEYMRVAGSEVPMIKVTYSGGWVTPIQAENDPTLTRNLPTDLEQLALDAMVSVYRNRGRDRSVVSEKVGSASVSYYDPRSGRRDSSQGTLAGFLPLHVAEGLMEYQLGVAS